MADHTGLRKRLASEITGRFGRLSTGSVREVAERAGVRYTTLARFLLYEGSGRTSSLQRRTINAVARVLGLSPGWLLDGQGDKQLGLWPVLVPDDSIQEPIDDLVQITRVFQFISELESGNSRATICRATAAVCIETAVREGVAIPGEVYLSLIRIDSLLTRRRESA